MEKGEQTNDRANERTNTLHTEKRKMVKMTLWQKEGRDIWLLGLREDTEVIHFCLGSFHFVYGWDDIVRKSHYCVGVHNDPDGKFFYGTKKGLW